MLVIGIVLVVVGILLILNKKRIENKIVDIKYFDRIDLKTAVENYNSIAAELGKGAFSQMVKLSAIAKTNSPLKGEFSKEDCVYYTATVTHKYKTLETRKDSEGKTKQVWVDHSETVGSTTRGDQFQLNDKTGEVTINIQGAEVTPHQAVDNFVAANNNSGFSFSFGSISFRNDHNYKTVGYNQSEDNIRVGTSLFIIGELNDRNGELMITQPADDDQPFIVSVKTEESMIEGLEGKAKMTFYGGIAVAVIGVGLAIASFFQ